MADKHIRLLENKELPDKIDQDNVLVTGSLTSFEALDEFNSHRGFGEFIDGKKFKECGLRRIEYSQNWKLDRSKLDSFLLKTGL